ncbi:DUF3667 domain-containing protein [Lunatimonas salinarum]|uniref:DUF3667 domain-containing protein n=1 Tax=Lunatimonas salinarum TaxID=1774590 RepID=UPI001AE0024E|nr:DUF3667 domain-containing protein [Lunatimonas salinarum]
MENQRKSDHCPNCGCNLPNQENFCPACGQENKDHKVPFFVFLKDFFESTLALESTFFRTLIPFFTNPGHLTRAFVSGKRKKYTHPIKLYLICSLLYFFVIGQLIPSDLIDRILIGGTNELEMERTPSVEIIDQTEADPTQTLTRENQVESQAEVNLAVPSQRSWKTLKFLSLDPAVSDEAFQHALDSAGISLGLQLATETKRKFIANSNLFIAKSAQNLPIMMFLLLPFFALLMKLLFFRGNSYYVEHLIHGLHLHAFAYVVYGFMISLALLLNPTGSGFYLYPFLLVSLYAFISIWRIQRQPFFRTLLKFLLLGAVYFLVLFIAVLVELYSSIWLL